LCKFETFAKSLINWLNLNPLAWRVNISAERFGIPEVMVSVIALKEMRSIEAYFKIVKCEIISKFHRLTWLLISSIYKLVCSILMYGYAEFPDNQLTYLAYISISH